MKFITVICIFVTIYQTSFAEEGKPIKGRAYVVGPGVVGNITFTQTSCTSPVHVEISVAGLSKGLHGFHIHEKGDLSGGCLSTGGHYNPDKLDHGAPDDEVRHIGDLGNIRADDNGLAVTSFTDNLITLVGPRSILGRGVVVHADEDDLGRGSSPDSKKTGNAGGRVACGVVGILEPFETVLPCSGNQQLLPSIKLLLLIFPFIIILLDLTN